MRGQSMTGWERALGTGLVAVATMAGAPEARAQSWEVGPTVPVGVTLVEVTRPLQSSSDQVLWTRLGAENGATVLVSDADPDGRSACDAACASIFPPIRADAGAAAAGDWTLVARDDGGSQWAYRGRPLYTWIEELEPGEVATNVGLAETSELKTAGSLAQAGGLLPPPGWAVARFEPAAGRAVPAGLDLRLVPSAHAVAVTDFEGYTLYAPDRGEACAAGGCDAGWVPVRAPALADTLGAFSVVRRPDGTRQWAHRGRPLYRYDGDALPGDAHGRSEAGWRVAAVSTIFRPAGVDVLEMAGYGDALTLDGRTLYAGSAFQKYWGGRNLRDSFKVAYFRGKRLGGEACADDSCRATWSPLRAPAEARSQGFWEVIPRRDGTRQWAYKGFALYTHADDTAPGHHRGHHIYEFTDPSGQREALERVAFLAGIGEAGGGAGIYWGIARP